MGHSPGPEGKSGFSHASKAQGTRRAHSSRRRTQLFAASFQNIFRQCGLMGRIHDALKEQDVLSVFRVLIAAGNERVAACASTVRVRGAWKPTTAPAESRFAGRPGDARCRLGCFFRRDWQKVGRDHASETEIRHEIALQSRCIACRAGTASRSGSCHRRHSEKKRNRKHCFPHTLPPCLRPMTFGLKF